MEGKEYVLIPKISKAKKRKDQAWATRTLGSLKPFDRWMREMMPDRRAQLEELCAQNPQSWGSPREFYDKFVAELIEIQRNGSPETYVAKELGRMGGKASAKSLTAKQRSERARKAGQARQAKARKSKGGAH